MTEVLAAPWLSKLPMELITLMGQRYGVDPFLIAAICMQESSGRSNATRYEQHYPWLYKVKALAEKFGCPLKDEEKGQMTSYGYMQVMGAVYREYGYMGRFDKACDPETNLNYGTKHLSIYLKRYDSAEKAIASYNAGSPRYKAGSRIFENQKYVDGVIKLWKEAAGVQSIA